MKKTITKDPPRFILLDDDLFALTLTAKVIRNYSRRTEIMTFSAVKEAIAYIEADDSRGKHTDTVFLTDLHMPETDGFALLDQVERSFKALRRWLWLHIFVVSADACPDEIQRLMSYHCVTGFYSKPLSLEKIMEIIDIVQYPL